MQSVFDEVKLCHFLGMKKKTLLILDIPEAANSTRSLSADNIFFLAFLSVPVHENEV